MKLCVLYDKKQSSFRGSESLAPAYLSAMPPVYEPGWSHRSFESLGLVRHLLVFMLQDAATESSKKC